MRARAHGYLFLFVFFVLAAIPSRANHLPSPDGATVYLEGSFTVLTGDPDPAIGGPARKLYVLTSDDGTDHLLHFSAGSLPAEGIPGLFHKRIQVTAALVQPTLMDGGGTPTVFYNVATVKVLPSAKASKVIGTLPFVTLLCRFADDPAEPQPPSFFTTQLSNTAPGFDHYFREASYNTIALTGSAVSATWVALPNPRSFYFDVNGVGVGSYLNNLFDHCTAAHTATINFTGFHGINLMFNGRLDNAAWGGGRCATLDGLNRCWSSTWMPFHGAAANQRFGWRTHSVLAHEMSHAFGAPHSDDPSGFEYGSGWDVVSSPGATCTAIDANYGCLGQHMNAFAKTLMGVIAAGRIAIHAPGATQSYNVERLALPPNVAGTHQVVRVNIAGTATRYYTVESRFRTGAYDSQLFADGVIIHEVNTNRGVDNGNPARLVVPGGTTAANTGRLAAIWHPGMTFRSAADNVAITVNSFSAANGTANVTVAPHTAFTDTFPPACALPAGWTVPAGATTGWSADPTNGAHGTCALKSDVLPTPASGGPRVRAEIQYTGVFIAGNIDFWGRISSESGFDCLRFTIDDVQQNVGTCTNAGLGFTPAFNTVNDSGWRFFSFPVTAGTHTVKWSYDKDDSAAGQDRAWIDSVTLPTVSGVDLTIAQVASPNPAAAGKDVAFTLTATNGGTVGATGVGITATIPAGSSAIWASPGCILAGSVYTCPLGALAANENKAVKIVVRPTAAGTATNNVTVAAVQVDGNPGNNASALAVPVVASPAAAQVLRYRLYSDITKEHHFTTDLNEYTVLGNTGGVWVQEGTVGKVLNNPGSFNGVQAVPYYRLYDNGTRWHHWTTDANEYYTLGLFPGWVQEGVDGYIFTTRPTGTVELFRLNYPALGALHHWTIDPVEYQQLILNFGWVGEPGAGFVIP